MPILAIESSTPSCSVAVWSGNTVIAAREMLAHGAALRHHPNLVSQSLPTTAAGEAKNSDVLLGEIRALLADAGLPISQLDAVAFGAGPGAFTGLRVACGVSQGIAMGCDIPVLPINNLLALAAQTTVQGETHSVLSVLDARMGEAYMAGYAVSGAETDRKYTEIIAPQLITHIATNPAAWPTTITMGDVAWRVVGNGVGLLPFDLNGKFLSVNAAVAPHAIEIAALGAAALARGEAVDCAYAIPLYLRNNVAQTIEERRNTGVSKAQFRV